MLVFVIFCTLYTVFSNIYEFRILTHARVMDITSTLINEKREKITEMLKLMLVNQQELSKVLQRV